MLKIRMQGMTSDIEWFQKILEEDKKNQSTWDFRTICKQRNK